MRQRRIDFRARWGFNAGLQLRLAAAAGGVNSVVRCPKSQAVALPRWLPHNEYGQLPRPGSSTRSRAGSIMYRARLDWKSVFLATICASGILTPRLALAHTGGGPDRSAENRNRSHFPIPPTGSKVDPSKFLPEHFERTAKATAALERYRKVMENPASFLKEPNQETLNRVAESILSGDLKLDPKDPLMQMMMDELRKPSNKDLLQSKWKDIQRSRVGPGVVVLPTQPGDQQSKQASGDSQPPGSPPEGGAPSAASQRQGASNELAIPGQTRGESPLSQWTQRLAKSLTAKDGVLRNSPSVQRAFEDFALSSAAGGGFSADSADAGDSLPGMLKRFMPENWLSESATESFGGLGSAILPELNRLDFRFTPPSLGSGGVGPADVRVGDMPGAEATLLWFLAAFVVALAAWSVYQRTVPRSSNTVDRPETLGPWPIAPESVGSPTDLIHAFEYLSLLKLGTKSRAWNHRTIARELGGKEASSQHMAGHLALLYEQARYALARPTCQLRPWTSPSTSLFPWPPPQTHELSCRTPASMFRLSGPPPARRVASGPGATPRVPPGQDNHAIRYILGRLNLQPLASQEEAETLKAGEVAIIVFGQPRPLERLSGKLRSFINNGGRLLFATDRRTSVLEADFGITVDGRLLAIDASSALAFHGLSQCPFVIALQDGEPSIFQGYSRIATNRPSFLEITGRSAKPIRPLARLPKDVEIESDQSFVRQRERLEPDAMFAAGGVVGKGRILVLADHSVFINDMMLQPDNDNFDFAVKALQWLIGPPTGGGAAPNRVLFVDEGSVVTNFNVPLKSSPGIPVPTAEALNQLLLGTEFDNVFNRLILHRFSPGQVLSVLALVLTGALLAYGGVRIAQSSHSIDPQAPLAVLNAGSALPSPGLIDQRHQTMLSEGKLWEAVREIARQTLGALRGGDDVAVESKASRADSHAVAPQFIVVGSASRRRYLTNVAVHLWTLAYTEKPRPLSLAEFRRVVTESNELARASREGTLQLNGVDQRDDRQS